MDEKYIICRAVKMSGAYQMYRSTTLGEALRQSLDELIAEGLISEQLAARVTTTFDQCINNALATRARNKVNFKVSNRMSKNYI